MSAFAYRGFLNGPAQRQKALNPDTAKLSEGALFQLKKHKLDTCTAMLKTMGLMQHEAQDAARLWGGDVETASDWHLESKLDPSDSRMHQYIACCISLAPGK